MYITNEVTSHEIEKFMLNIDAYNSRKQYFIAFVGEINLNT